jgi:hypothetical protein
MACSRCMLITSIKNLNDDNSTDLFATAHFQYGGPPPPPPLPPDWQYMLDVDGPLPGYLLWDASHELPTECFSSVASVRMHAERIPPESANLRLRWSVGTSPFLETTKTPWPTNHRIHTVRVWAEVPESALSCLVRWDYIQVETRPGPGACWESFICPATPIVNRLGVPVPDINPSDVPLAKGGVYQMALLRFPNGVDEIRITGQITLQGNVVRGWEGPLTPGCMSGGIKLHGGILP